MTATQIKDLDISSDRIRFSLTCVNQHAEENGVSPWMPGVELELAFSPLPGKVKVH